MCGMMSGVGTLFLSMVMFLGWMTVIPASVETGPAEEAIVIEEAPPPTPANVDQAGVEQQDQPVPLGWREVLTIMPDAGAIHAVDWSPDGMRIITGGDDGIVRIWNAQTGEELDQFEGNPSGPVWSVAWSPDNRTIASGADDGTVRAWNADLGFSEWMTGYMQTWVSAIAWDRTGSRIASAHSDGVVRVWYGFDGVLMEEFDGGEPSVNDVDWDYTGDHLAAASGSGYYDNVVRIWVVPFRQTNHAYWGHLGEVWAVAYSPDGTRVASGSSDHTVRVWSVYDGDPMFVFEGHTATVTAVDWDPTGQFLVSAGGDGTLRIWDMATGGSVATIFDAHPGWISSVAWANDGRIVSAGADGVIRVWGQ